MESVFESIKTDIVGENNDIFSVEYEVVTLDESSEISQKIEEIDKEIAISNEKIAILNSKIERFTNQGDKIDYTIAAASGVICGLLDAFFVGEWDFKSAKDYSNEKINKSVLKYCKADPQYLEKCQRCGKDPNRLQSAVDFLEEKYPLPGDNDWNFKKKFIDKAKKEYGFVPSSGSGKYDDAIVYMKEKFPNINTDSWGLNDNGITMKTHHLDDFCHHPSLIGLISCLTAQFSGSATYYNSSGANFHIPIAVNDYGQLIGADSPCKILCGIINWFFNAAQTIKNRNGHLMSDIAGSSGSVGGGMGLPGPFMSLLKELSTLPGLDKTNFGEMLRKAFQNGIGEGKSQVDLGVFNELFSGASNKFDLRTETAILHELKKQSWSIIVNEALVRSAYFIRRFIQEYKNCHSISQIQKEKIIPFWNGTIARMITIASGTFMVIDMADAAIHGAIESEGSLAGFAKGFIVRVNFVGIGRFAVAVGADVGMGIKKNNLRNERMQVMAQQLSLQNVKLFYKNAEVFLKVKEVSEAQKQMWISAQNTVEELSKIYQSAQETYICYFKNMSETFETFEKCAQDAPEFCKNNSEIVADAKSILKFGGYKKYGKQ